VEQAISLMDKLLYRQIFFVRIHDESIPQNNTILSKVLELIAKSQNLLVFAPGSSPFQTSALSPTQLIVLG
jgi:hypothetical protein